jgi:hypothetical protein
MTRCVLCRLPFPILQTQAQVRVHVHVGSEGSTHIRLPPTLASAVRGSPRACHAGHVWCGL